MNLKKENWNAFLFLKLFVETCKKMLEYDYNMETLSTILKRAFEIKRENTRAELRASTNSSFVHFRSFSLMGIDTVHTREHKLSVN